MVCFVVVCIHLVVVLLLCDSFGEAEVTDLGVVLCDQQHVPGSEVSVDKVMLLQILHPHRHLVDQLCDVLQCRLSVGDQSLLNQCHSNYFSSVAKITDLV